MNHRKTHFVFYLLILFSCLKYNPSHAQNNRSAAEKLYQKALRQFMDESRKLFENLTTTTDEQTEIEYQNIITR